VYKAPPVDEEMWKAHMRLGNLALKSELPDVCSYHYFTLVSERFREVVDAVDPLPHQFFPAPITDNDHSGLAMSSTFYWMHVRRIVKIADPVKPGPAVAALDFRPLNYERPLLATILDFADIRAMLEQYPLWMFKSGDIGSLYMNESMVTALRQANVAGMIDCTPNSSEEENLGHV
jgi:hypothetical protein